MIAENDEDSAVTGITAASMAWYMYMYISNTGNVWNYDFDQIYHKKSRLSRTKTGKDEQS